MTIFDWINQINYEKKSWDSFSEAEQKTFNTFIINRWLSMDEELIQIVNFFQKYSIGLLEPKDTYMWYRDIIPKKKRFNKYIKGKKAMKYDSELITTICKYYETSKNECIEYIEMMDKKQLTSILELHGKEPKQIKKLLKGKK
jgi:hypothetical protein